ncbi:general transcription factor IIE subunit 1-like isoform X2 [Dysidea avara]|uniref:general transcription factor IIE subunit 1-like isoform X2 n=1 Tax=Dysidea avara TaxID=196820 RepID=UPI00332CAD2C
MTEPDQEVLTEVPKQLHTLARVIARMFYQPDHIAIIDVLVHHQCIKEEDLLELLLLDGKQLRQALNYLKKDKVVRSIQKPETTEEGKIVRSSYYYINYKHFVNMVKYKLDHMRKKIESEEKQMRNRTSYLCGNCNKTFQDLEVNQLIDVSTGQLRCTYCSNELEESIDTECSTQLISMARFNTLIRPINSLLKQTENINLAPEVLEPAPQSGSVLHLKKGYSSHGNRTKSLSESWTTSKGIDLYGEQSGVKVEIGDGQQTEAALKEAPEWMQFSTVDPQQSVSGSQQQVTPSSSETWTAQTVTDLQRDKTIKAELLAHEKSQPSFNRPPQDESSNSDEDSSPITNTTNQQVDNSSESESESEGDQYSITLGGKVYALNEINDDLIAKMTDEEKQTYTALCREVYNDDFF